MKAGWYTEKIGNICELATGGTPSRSKPEYFNGNIKWLVSGDIHQKEIFDCKGRISEVGMKNSNARFLPINSIMIALNGQGKTRGSVSLLRTNATCNQSLVSISPKDSNKLIPEFLYLNLNGRYEEIRRITGDDGNDRRGLNMPLIRNITIPIAPIDEQQRIVGILDQAFESIAKARTNAEQNLQNARALFESHLQSVFTQRGDGWEQKRLGDIAELFDSLHKTPSYQNVGYPMVRVTDIKPGILNLSNTRKVDENTFIEFSKKHVPKPGDIVFSRVGSYGVSALVATNEVFCLGQNTVFIVPKINSYLLYYFLNSSNAKEQIDGFVDGTTQPTISLKNIREIVVSIPHPNKQQEIVTNFDVIAAETKRLETHYQRKITLLDELKKSLLQQAFSGEL